MLIRGSEMGCVNVPLHRVYLESDLVTGPVTLGVCSRLPVDGVSLILGNELAGGKVFPRPIVVHKPSVDELPDLSLYQILCCISCLCCDPCTVKDI